MDEAALHRLVAEVRDGTVSPDDAVAALRRLPFADLGFARVDHHRTLRQGMAEAVYAPGKSPDQCAAIVGELLAQPAASPIVLSRADDAQALAALGANPGGLRHDGPQGTSTLTWRRATVVRPERVAVVTAGTADLPVAEECAAVLGAHGFEPLRITDVGVAGLHRILDAAEEIAAADVVVVAAGMEGALASVVGGLTAAPVVAVPTSVGYGAGLDGVTALLAMLAACASGITVVGIDNGFGAACAVVRQLGARAPVDAPSGDLSAVVGPAASPGDRPAAATIPAGGETGDERAAAGSPASRADGAGG
ncbi:MAG: nickel pincer cofactor biosynthesis protein LarB [Acidimicrobiales bacterium]